jgi:hypothetical protein
MNFDCNPTAIKMKPFNTSWIFHHLGTAKDERADPKNPEQEQN